MCHSNRQYKHSDSGVYIDMRPIWTDEQVTFLKANYATMKTAELLKVLTDKTNDQLRWKAKMFKLQKRVTQSKADMTWLEDFDSPETCYWWGFITADGCINDRSLIVAVHERDEIHLKRFCIKANTNISRSTKPNDWSGELYTMVRTALSDKYTLERLRARLKIRPRKTYNPLNISEFFTPNRLCYWLAGYIDGDGHIGVMPQHNTVTIRIKVHSNWKPVLEQISNKMLQLYGIESKVWLSKEGWACMSMSKKRHIVRLYDLIEKKVPFMDRKWTKLDSIRTHCALSRDKRLDAIGENPSESLMNDGPNLIQALVAK